MYLIKRLSYFFLFCFFATSYAQSVKVLDKTTKVPIAGVAVFNQSQTITAITNSEGLVDLSRFSNKELIFLQHISFNLKGVKKDSINSNTIYLERNELGLNEIIISASNFKQNKREIPKSIATVSAEQISFYSPQTSADLLENTGKVYIQKSQLGGGSPMIRGFSTNRLLITVDGVRMNNAIFRGGNLQNVISIDPLSIKKTEVILGAGSTIYGSDAIGGVMSFYTKTPKLSYLDSLIVDSNLMLRYATANQEKTAHIDVNLGLKKWGFLTNITYTDFNDLRMGSHGPTEYLRPEYVVTQNNQDVIIENNNPKIQKFTGYNQINLMQKVAYKPKDDLDFDLGLFYTTTSAYPRYDRLIRYRGDNLRSAEWNYGPQRWFMSNLKVTKRSSKATFYDNVKATFAYQNFQESRMDRNFQDIERNVREEAVNALSFNLDLEKELSTRSNLFYGFEYVFNKVNSIGYTGNIEDNTTQNTVSRYPDGATWHSAAVYANYKFKPTNKFVFQSG